MRVETIGVLAHSALAASGGRARRLARLSASVYLTAGDAIVWLGLAGATLHPRAILVAALPDPDADDLVIDTSGAVPWRPTLPVLDAPAVERVRECWRRLAPDLGSLGEAGGFGALLTGRPLGFPLRGAREAALTLAGACARDDAAAAAVAAPALLGLGGGLTPSGDDYVGGALFARAWLATTGDATTADWERAATIVVAAAPARTHPISAALLGDLAAGLAWAPLHDLAAALAADLPAAALDAAHRLTRLGHTSGWDLLAGFGAGLGGLTASTVQERGA
jgi:uncharacterized protein DUF2877